jgi:hypothetical protein
MWWKTLNQYNLVITNKKNNYSKFRTYYCNSHPLKNSRCLKTNCATSYVGLSNVISSCCILIWVALRWMNPCCGLSEVVSVERLLCKRCISAATQGSRKNLWSSFKPKSGAGSGKLPERLLVKLTCIKLWSVSRFATRSLWMRVWPSSASACRPGLYSVDNWGSRICS